MATILLMVFFSDKGVPKTALSPTIDGYEDDGTQVITAQAMTEVAGGWYKYSFGSYDETKNYGFIADGTGTLNVNDRYAYGSNEIGQVTGGITGVKGDTAAILIDTDTMETDLKAHIDTAETNLTTEIDTNETKIDTVKVDTGAILIDTDTMEADLKTHMDTKETNIISEVDANETKIDSIVTLLTRSIGLMQENQYLDTTVYDADNNLTSGRIRIYSVAGSVGTDSDVLATYTITATYNDDNELQTYKVVKA